MFVAGALAALALTATAASAQGATATVTGVHGFPDTPLDLYVDDELTLDDFAPGTVTEPMELAAGTHLVDLVDPDAQDNSVPLVSVEVDLAAGANVSLVGHLSAEGDPMVDVFTNDVSALEADEARATVRHVAAAPAVDVLADGNVLVEDLASGDEAVATVPSGDHDLELVTVDGGDAVLAAPATTLPAGTNTIMYGVGSLDGGSMEVLVQEIGGLGTEPQGVPAGDGGLVDDDSLLPVIALTLVGVAALGFAFRRRDRVQA